MATKRRSLALKEDTCGDIIPLPDDEVYEIHTSDDLLMAFKVNPELRDFMLMKVFYHAGKKNKSGLRLHPHPLVIDVSNPETVRQSLKNEVEAWNYILGRQTAKYKFFILQVKGVISEGSWHFFFIVFDTRERIYYVLDPNNGPPKDESHWANRMFKSLEGYVDKKSNKSYREEDLFLQNFNFHINEDLKDMHKGLGLTVNDSRVPFCSILTFAYLIDIACGYEEEGSMWREDETSNRILRFFQDLFRGKVPQTLTPRHKMEIILYVRSLVLKLWKNYGATFLREHPYLQRRQIRDNIPTTYMDVDKLEKTTIRRVNKGNQRILINENLKVTPAPTSTRMTRSRSSARSGSRRRRRRRR